MKNEEGVQCFPEAGAFGLASCSQYSFFPRS
jgi:hypothetical protein